MDINAFNEIGTVNHHMGCKSHTHVNCEFLFILSGSVNNKVGNDSKTLSVGDICFMNTNNSHVLEYQSEKSWHRDLFISTEHLRELCLKFYDQAFFDYLMQNDKHILIPITSGHFDSVITKLSSIEITYKYNKTDREFYIKSLFSIIIELLGTLYYSIKINDSNNQTNEMIISLLEKLNNPDFFTLSIKDIIKSTNYSHSHFDLLFKKKLGCTIKKYVTNLKINYAKDLLIQTDLSLSDIAYKLKYDSQSHFTQIFKKFTNLTPKDYRKSHM